jgi:hypothetical protein
LAKQRPLRASTRFSKTTPDGLRLRVLDAIPMWEKIPRKGRQALAMLPVYGTFEAACEAVGADMVELGKDKYGQYLKKIVADWKITGKFPEHTRKHMTRKRGEKRQEVAVKIPITQAEMLQQLANELAAIALIKAEEALTGATAVKMANEAGWFLNLEAEVEKERAYTDDRIADSMRRRVARRNESLPSEDAEDDVPLFEQDEEVKDDFTGETEAAQANTNGDAAGTIPDLNDTGAGANKR